MGYWETEHGLHRLKPGDEKRNWRTFAELQRDEGLTRGALDALVLAGKVPTVTGDALLAFLHPWFEAAVRLGATVPPPVEPGQQYFALEDNLKLHDAARRLGAQESPLMEWLRANKGLRVFDNEGDT